MGVQGLAVQGGQAGVEGLQGRAAHQVGADFAQAAVGGVADDRVAGERRVDADLVGPARLQDGLDPGEVGQVFQQAHLGDGVADARRRALPRQAGVLEDRHALAVVGVAGDGGVNDGVLEGQAAPEQGVVLADRRAGLDLLAQALVGEVVLGDDDQAGRVFVQAMDDAGALDAADAGQVAAVGEQGVDQRARLGPRRGVDDQALGLVDDDEVGVLVDDVERDGFGLGLLGAAGGRASRR